MAIIRRVARVALSVGICALALYIVGVREILDVLRDIRPIYLFLALSLTLIDSGLRSINWNQIISHFTPLSMGRAWSIYLSGAFYGLLIPSSVGTDAARAMTITRRASIDIRICAGSLVTLNILGLGAVATVATMAVLAPAAANTTPFLLLTLTFSSAVAICSYALMFTGIGRLFVARMGGLFDVWPAAQRKLQPFVDATLVLPQGRRDRVKLVITALFNQMIRVTIVFIAARALGISLEWWVLAATAPLVAIVSMIPLSFFGIGIDQGAMVLILAPFGVSSADSFALSLTNASVYLGLSLAGGAVVLFESAFGRRV
jgi:uncharacterized protein (TIRG00374 family)